MDANAKTVCVCVCVWVGVWVGVGGGGVSSVRDLIWVNSKNSIHLYTPLFWVFCFSGTLLRDKNQP